MLVIYELLNRLGASPRDLVQVDFGMNTIVNGSVKKLFLFCIWLRSSRLVFIYRALSEES